MEKLKPNLRIKPYREPNGNEPVNYERQEKEN